MLCAAFAYYADTPNTSERRDRAARAAALKITAREEVGEVFVIFRDNASEWRWHLLAENNRKIADSGEGYSTEQACRDGIALVKRIAPTAQIQVKVAR